ncbi:glycine-rich domain-containing protein [Streptomyces sp. NPDC057555]|uniref:glycine-rich domain-containing protein n=1 Tax=Streptomyces sp. NPDC057555 TaxID=3346166 RepID=UPI0036B821C7
MNDHTPSDVEGKDVTITLDSTTNVFELIGPDMRADLIQSVREDGWVGLTDELGERGVDQLVAFLATSADIETRLAPSLRVDLFWHAFVLRTKPYADFCAALGSFVHHVPDRGSHSPAEGRAVLARTKEAISAAGYQIDPEFWPSESGADCSADCSQCHAGCTDSPVKK